MMVLLAARPQLIQTWTPGDPLIRSPSSSIGCYIRDFMHADLLLPAYLSLPQPTLLSRMFITVPRPTTNHYSTQVLHMNIASFCASYLHLRAVMYHLVLPKHVQTDLADCQIALWLPFFFLIGAGQCQILSSTYFKAPTSESLVCVVSRSSKFFS